MDDFGISPPVAARLREIFEQAIGVERVWMYGSRARGDHRESSDIDLCVDAPEMEDRAFSHLKLLIQDDGLIYGIDVTRWQTVGNADFRARIERDRKLFWSASRRPADRVSAGGIGLKEFQSEVIGRLGGYLAALKAHGAEAEAAAKALRVMENMRELAREASDFPKQAWAGLQKRGALPVTFAGQPHSSRFDGADRPIPNVCLKIPTGGGKTLLAAACVARVFSSYLGKHAGLVLWVVPNDAIYKQTLKALSDRDHPYRQILNVAGAGKVKILEKHSPLTAQDVASHLCVMVLMLASAARQSKETLRFFRDRGNVLGFLPREDDAEAHWELLREVPNLDVYAPWGQTQEGARAQKGSIVKSSLGNVMRMIRPMVVLDEGHHGYTENALKTLDGFNPSFLLELSATPRVSSAKGPGSNVLVDIRGADLERAEMIKLPIQVDVRHWTDWQSCLAASLSKLDQLHGEAEQLQNETGRYIRPILLVQVERTGSETRDAGFIHAEDAKAYLMQLGLSERQIAIKTSDKDELKQPENINLLAATCEVRAIITKQALQEGWDCPFAYVLCALAAGRNTNAMTQLVGRILRQPHVAKTGREALDGCYVLCHDANTGKVVKSIKSSLEEEGMGDLTLTVTGDGGTGGGGAKKNAITLKRREAFSRVRLFLPRVTWAEPGQPRRELVYESDVLAGVRWHDLNTAALATEWAPNAEEPMGEQFAVGLEILAKGLLPKTHHPLTADTRLDRVRIVRSLLDLAPNAWLVWEWVDAVVARLIARGFAESRLAIANAGLIEQLRIDVEKERDRLAEAVFAECLQDGRVEFALRADDLDYELPTEMELEFTTQPPVLTRKDYRSAEKSLLEPALQTADMNEYEIAVAGYLDGKQAVQWWHRNVAKTQYGLQGWRRHKVYPDFVFAQLKQDGASRMVLLETKGLHLKGSDDTGYKEQLLERLSAAFRDESLVRGGELRLEGPRGELVCDLLFDEATWENRLENRYFQD